MWPVLCSPPGHHRLGQGSSSRRVPPVSVRPARASLQALTPTCCKDGAGVGEGQGLPFARARLAPGLDAWTH